jgi:prophage regulatory protein
LLYYAHPRHMESRATRRVELRGDMYDIPETGFLRLSQVLSVIPLGKTTWWEGVRSGRFPKPRKLSARCTAWRAEDIRDLIARLSNESLTT